MLKITLPKNNKSEREYIVDIIFGEFLGLEYEIVWIDGRNKDEWKIELENKNILIFEDHFFHRYPDNLAYLQLDNIPSKIEFAKNQFTTEKDIPVIFGSSTLSLQPLTCGIDIFASSFFMLTRWEEYVNKNRDVHNRFSAKESLAYKHNFLDRPIVNEYTEMLWGMLEHLGIKQQRKKREFQLYLTHDVDVPLKVKSLTMGIKRLKVSIKERNVIIKFISFFNPTKISSIFSKDAYDTFDYIMNTSEKNGVKSYFFFMAHGVTEYDNMYMSSDKFIQNLIIKIKRRGHHIGIHPSYNAYNDTVQLKKEKNELEKNLKTEILYGREHYLRFEVPTTWQIWEDNGMEWDSTLVFADKEGFRCGTCYEYSVFNIYTSQKLKLKEKPLILMEGNFITYQPEIGPDQMQRKITNLIDKTKKYHGNFICLWHNSKLETQCRKNMYESIIQYTKKVKNENSLYFR